MADGGKVVIKIDGDTSGFNKAIGTIGSVTTAGAKVAVGAISAIGSGIVALGAIGVNYNKQIETYTTNFGVMLGDTALAIEKVEQLKEMGAKTPFELPELASATEQLLAFGVANEDTQGYLQQLGDISLGNVDKLNTLVNAFGKMNSTGKVTLETINMMSEQGFNPLQEISRTTGESMESLYDRVSAGAVSLDEITGAFESATSAGGQFEGGMEKASQTTEGLISTLKDNATALVGEVFMPISDSILSDVLPSAIDGIAVLSEAFKEDGVEGLIEAGGELLGGLITGITEKIPDLADLAINLLTTLTESLIANAPTIALAAGELLTALANGIFTLLPMLTTLALELIINFGEYLAENADNLVTGAISMLLALNEVLLDNLPLLFQIAIDIIMAIVDSIVKNANLWIEAAINSLTKIAEFIVENLPLLIDAAIEIIMAIVEYLINNIGLLVDASIQIILAIVGGLISAIPRLITGVLELIDAIIETIISTDWGKVGEDIVDGFWNGIKSMWSNVTDWFDDAIDGLVGGVKDLLGINSPSKVFEEEIGYQLPAGAAVGIKKGVPLMDKALTDMLDVDAMKRTLDASVYSNLGSVSPYSNSSVVNNSNQTNETIINVNVDGNTLAQNNLDALGKQLGEKIYRQMRGRGVVNA